jgi:flagella basal body P-ring formation protein FlgA
MESFAVIVGKTRENPNKSSVAWLLLNASRMEVRFYFAIAVLAVFGLSADAGELQLNAVAAVSGDGVYLPQIFSAADPLPAIKLSEAPAFGKNLVLSRDKIIELLSQNAPNCGTNFSGADEIKISRRARTFDESDVLGLLTARLQNDFVKDRGQLELHLAQPWSPLVLPDETLTLDVQDIPSLGVSPNFMVRFSLRTANETLGTWTANLKASVWREVCVASHQLTRGDQLTPDIYSRERRDVLGLHGEVADLSAANDALEATESVPAGATFLTHMIKPRTVIHRGQNAEALVQDGALSVKTKVQILEDGAPGEIVRARNVSTNRDLSGKVLDDKTILITL